MLADAFSMFDYGGSMGLTGLIRWCSCIVVFYLFFSGSDLWVSDRNLVYTIKLISEGFGLHILGKRRIIFGFSLFCVRLFVYLAFVGVYSIFPYIFCMTAHFSHNFCISIILWFSTLILNLFIRVSGFIIHFVPRGLVWYQAAPVALFEIIRNLRRFITLGARLTMNIIAGKLLLCVGRAFFGAMLLNGMVFSLGGVCFLSLLLALTSWEMVVGIIQAYIFTFLSVTYIDEAPTHRAV